MHSLNLREPSLKTVFFSAWSVCFVGSGVVDAFLVMTGLLWLLIVLVGEFGFLFPADLLCF
jgi:hypothetical protein